MPKAQPGLKAKAAAWAKAHDVVALDGIDGIRRVRRRRLRNLGGPAIRSREGRSKARETKAETEGDGESEDRIRAMKPGNE